MKADHGTVITSYTKMDRTGRQTISIMSDGCLVTEIEYVSYGEGGHTESVMRDCPEVRKRIEAAGYMEDF